MSGILGAVVASALVVSFAPTAVRAGCVGDCDGDGKVAISELVIGVRIALGRNRIGECGSIDAGGDGKAGIEEVLAAVNASLDGCLSGTARLVALGRDGRIASLDIAPPWTVRESGDLGAVTASVRCRAGRCLVVHPSPADSISVVAASGLSREKSIVLEHGADPRDVALVDDRTAVVGQYGRAELLEIDLATQATVPIDLSALADADGLPETLRLASCGRRVFAQLRRVDHDSGAPAPVGAALAVIDLDRAGDDRLVDADPATPGTQAIALAGRPDFDMPVDCAAGVLYVAEPVPLMQGGGWYEVVDLETLTAHDLPIDTGAEVGGFEVVSPGEFWLITHTEFGPGASSHLTFTAAVSPDTYNTFAGEHVDDLALDREEDRLFFPDNCVPGPANPSCDSGVHVFNATTGARVSAGAIDVGFPPVEVAVSR